MNVRHRLTRLESALGAGRRQPRSADEMTDAELEEIIGIHNPTDEQLAAIIQAAADGQEDV